MDDKLELVANDAADKAVRKTFAIMGVNVDDPRQLEDFRRDVRFAGDLRSYAGRSMLTLTSVCIGGLLIALWTGVKVKLGG